MRTMSILQSVSFLVLFSSSISAFSQTPAATPAVAPPEPFQINGEILTRTRLPSLTLQRDAAGAMVGLDLRQETRQEINKGGGPVKKCVETLTLTLRGKIAVNEAFNIAANGQNRAQFTHSCAGEPLVTHDLAGTAKVTQLPAPDEVGIFGIEADVKSTTGKAGKGKIETIGYDGTTKRCPKELWEFCDTRGMELQAVDDVKSAELLYGLTCNTGARDGEARDGMSLQGCMLLSRIWAARGQADKARELRRKSCAAQPDMCLRFSMIPGFMDAATLVDLTPVLCKLPSTGMGLGNALLGPMCKLGDNLDLTRWAAFLSKTYKTHESRIATIRAANRGKPVTVDFVAKPALWKTFDLKSQKFPVRVRFPVSGIDSLLSQIDVDASNKQNYGQLIQSTLKARIQTDKDSMETLTGHLCADSRTLLNLSVKYPLTGGFRAAGTGTIIGYKSTGAMELPVIVLD